MSQGETFTIYLYISLILGNFDILGMWGSLYWIRAQELYQVQGWLQHEHRARMPGEFSCIGRTYQEIWEMNLYISYYPSANYFINEIKLFEFDRSSNHQNNELSFNDTQSFPIRRHYQHFPRRWSTYRSLRTLTSARWGKSARVRTSFASTPRGPSSAWPVIRWHQLSCSNN